jgi:putative heme-binding domain-containing protein
MVVLLVLPILHQTAPAFCMMIGMRMRNITGAGLLVFSALSLRAQHSYTAADVEDGARLYQATCSGCHGPEGDLVEGVNFSRGKFLSASSDEDLTRTILKGIPGTPMPASSFSDPMVFTVVAYLRSMPAHGQSSLPPGNAARGKVVFEGDGGCLTCHRVGARGSRMGPDLTAIGGLRRGVQLEKSLIETAKTSSPEYRTVHLVTKSGVEYKGRLLNLDTFTIQVLDSGERLRSFYKTDLKDYSLGTSYEMPSYKGKLTNQQLADVVSYMVALKGTSLKGTDTR